MIRPDPTRRHRPSEEGYILLWVLFLLAVFTIFMSVAAPKIAKEIQRDRERETLARGKQYTRAIQLYYRKFHAFPPNQDALIKTNEIRFLRKKYIDPITRKDDWKPIRFGQAKTQTLGFFGKPIAGTGSAGGSLLAGIGPSGGNGINGGSLFAPTDSGTNPAATQAGAPGVPTTPGAPGASATSSPSTGLTGQTFGGAGIVGFSPASAKPSILIYRKKSHYNEWEFVYDPLSEMKTISGNSGNIGQPATNTTAPIGSPALNSPNNGPGFNSPNNNGPGVNNGPGSNPTPIPPIPPTSPEQ